MSYSWNREKATVAIAELERVRWRGEDVGEVEKGQIILVSVFHPPIGSLLSIVLSGRPL